MLRRAATLDAGCSGPAAATGDRANPLRLQCAPSISGWGTVARGKGGPRHLDPRGLIQARSNKVYLFYGVNLEVEHSPLCQVI